MGVLLLTVLFCLLVISFYKVWNRKKNPSHYIRFLLATAGVLLCSVWYFAPLQKPLPERIKMSIQYASDSHEIENNEVIEQIRPILEDLVFRRESYHSDVYFTWPLSVDEFIQIRVYDVSTPNQMPYWGEYDFVIERPEMCQLLRGLKGYKYLVLNGEESVRRLLEIPAICEILSKNS